MTRAPISSGDSDSEGSDWEEGSSAPPKCLKLDNDLASFLAEATRNPLEREKRKKFVECFPLPALNAAHPPKLDKDLAALIPKSASNYDKLLSKFGMDALGPLLMVLTKTKTGKCTMKELVSPLEAAIMLAGNAAAQLSLERSRALLKHMNTGLKSLAEGDFPERGPLLFGNGFDGVAKTTVDNVKALSGTSKWRGYMWYGTCCRRGIGCAG